MIPKALLKLKKAFSSHIDRARKYYFRDTARGLGGESLSDVEEEEMKIDTEWSNVSVSLFESDISFFPDSFAHVEAEKRIEKRAIVYHSAIQIYYSLLENIVQSRVSDLWAIPRDRRAADLCCPLFPNLALLLRDNCARDRDLFPTRRHSRFIPLKRSLTMGEIFLLDARTEKGKFTIAVAAMAHRLLCIFVFTTSAHGVINCCNCGNYSERIIRIIC